jgi:long-chain-fatty-acid--CoA ligase ACSBG
VNAIKPYWNKLSELKKIVVWGEKISDSLYSNDILRWEDVMNLGMVESLFNFPVLDRQKNMAINQCCVLIYTSGTTGNPKGAKIVKIYKL